jgi:hypothetical protein
MGRDNPSEMTSGRDNGEDSKKGVRSSSANADADALALISGVVGTVRSIQDTESRALHVKNGYDHFHKELCACRDTRPIPGRD